MYMISYQRMKPVFSRLNFGGTPRYLAGNLEVGARVQAARPISYDRLAPVVTGSVGTVVGPALDEPLARIVVRWDGPAPNGAPLEREAHADDVKLMKLGWLIWFGSIEFYIGFQILSGLLYVFSHSLVMTILGGLQLCAFLLHYPRILRYLEGEEGHEDGKRNELVLLVYK